MRARDEGGREREMGDKGQELRFTLRPVLPPPNRGLERAATMRACQSLEPARNNTCPAPLRLPPMDDPIMGSSVSSPLCKSALSDGKSMVSHCRNKGCVSVP